MATVKKQLKIWQDDFLKYYGRTSLVMRIAIGAGICFGIVYAAMHYWIKPANMHVAELKKKISETAVSADVDWTIMDLQNRERKTAALLRNVQAENKALTERNASLNRGEHGKTIIELRHLLDDNSLRIIEERVVQQAVQAPTRRKRGQQTQVQVADTKVKVVLPEAMGCECYSFKILGSFGDIRRFLHDAYNADSLFYLNNISIKRSVQLITDRQFRQFSALELTFEAHLPYLKGK